MHAIPPGPRLVSRPRPSSPHKMSPSPFLALALAYLLAVTSRLPPPRPSSPSPSSSSLPPHLRPYTPSSLSALAPRPPPSYFPSSLVPRPCHVSSLTLGRNARTRGADESTGSTRRPYGPRTACMGQSNQNQYYVMTLLSWLIDSLVRGVLLYVDIFIIIASYYRSLDDALQNPKNK